MDQPQLPSPPPPAYFKPAEAATYLRISLSLLNRLRREGKGPSYSKLGDGKTCAIRYSRADLDGWMALRKVSA